MISLHADPNSALWRQPLQGVLVATVVVVLLASMAVGNGGIGMYDPCANVTVQRGDEFTFHVAFAVRDAFSSGGVQLSL
jgi:hypothetical protein